LLLVPPRFHGSGELLLDGHLEEVDVLFGWWVIFCRLLALEKRFN
jgi:hypothetical protein